MHKLEEVLPKVPSGLSPEERGGWESARKRVEEMDKDDPHALADEIEELLEATEDNGTPTSRGRLRAFNEFVDALRREPEDDSEREASFYRGDARCVFALDDDPHGAAMQLLSYVRLNGSPFAWGDFSETAAASEEQLEALEESLTEHGVLSISADNDGGSGEGISSDTIYEVDGLSLEDYARRGKFSSRRVLADDKVGSEDDVERKAERIFSSGGVGFIGATAVPGANRVTWEFDVRSTSGRNYAIYCDTDVTNPRDFSDRRSAACQCAFDSWNFDRAPRFKHLEHRFCSHLGSVNLWLSENGERETEAALAEAEPEIAPEPKPETEPEIDETPDEQEEPALEEPPVVEPNAPLSEVGIPEPAYTQPVYEEEEEMMKARGALASVGKSASGDIHIFGMDWCYEVVGPDDGDEFDFNDFNPAVARQMAFNLAAELWEPGMRILYSPYEQGEYGLIDVTGELDLEDSDTFSEGDVSPANIDRADEKVASRLVERETPTDNQDLTGETHTLSSLRSPSARGQRPLPGRLRTVSANHRLRRGRSGLSSRLSFAEENGRRLQNSVSPRHNAALGHAERLNTSFHSCGELYHPGCSALDVPGVLSRHGAGHDLFLSGEQIASMMSSSPIPGAYNKFVIVGENAYFWSPVDEEGLFLEEGQPEHHHVLSHLGVTGDNSYTFFGYLNLDPGHASLFTPGIPTGVPFVIDADVEPDARGPSESDFAYLRKALPGFDSFYWRDTESVYGLSTPLDRDSGLSFPGRLALEDAAYSHVAGYAKRNARKVAEHEDVEMVALVPPRKVRELLAVEGGEDPEELHVTLAVIPVPADRTHFRDDVEEWARSISPLAGRISGYGQFLNDDESSVLYAGVDVPDITDVRESLSEMLEDGLYTDDTDGTHGFTPHLSLKYSDEPVREFPELPEGLPKEFSFNLILTNGDEWIDIPWDSARAVKAAAKVVEAPNEYDNESPPRIFLAGSIQMGTAEEWQTRAAELLGDEDCLILNPRREDWDDSWEQSIDDARFKEQASWELDALEKADIVLLYFDPETESPITLLELGLYAGDHTNKLVVCCPEGFFRKGNVDVVCQRYGIQQAGTLEEAVAAVRDRLYEYLDQPRALESP